MLDCIVIGSGPNGLVAAATLARAGVKVLLLEAKERVGGAVGTLALTEPGFHHDLGAGFFPFGQVSPGLATLDLPGAGLRWRYAPIESAHVSADGAGAFLSRDTERTVQALGKDGPAWREWATWNARHGERLVQALVAPLPALGPGLKLGTGIFRFAQAGLSTSAELAERTFATEGARRIVPDLALHADLGPDDFSGGAVGMVLALLAARSGFGVAEGGAGEIARAITQRLTEAGGQLRTGARVAKVRVEKKQVMGVRLASGEEIDARIVVADTGPRALCLDLVGAEHLPGRVIRAMEGFEYGWGTFKLDWALDGLPPWSHAPARESAVVHVGGGLGGLRAFTHEIREGKLPEHPYVLVGQQSLADPTRAPPGKHTLYAYTHVPSVIPGGWDAQRESFADRVEGWIEACAPGFRKLIRARKIHAPPDLEAMNENLVGGDLGGGSAQIGQQLFFRPAFPYFRYRLPLRGLYLGSASTHPGTGVHGACGYNAARAVLADL